VRLFALVLKQQEQTVFQRLREWYLDAKHKNGKKRQEVEVASCFAPLLRWIVRLWEQGDHQMALVLDATTLRERWTILSISVVLRSCAIPVAWKVLRGHEKGSWRPHWEGLLKHLDGCIPLQRTSCRGVERPWVAVPSHIPASCGKAPPPDD
jgi:hypothetical protein